ncbi:Acg family FMN-binding oxidoreductase [Saccharopolyspora phatthalungensis]|uniref:Nitroreductase n=1 Tax=Saccharopolyspora phatthalungensis TaxID=664693 RepID=A0A840QJ00_9PSEU|nr:nitroreductase family protein [Saccharopolyspora phatthalungensis]MBB5157493.1 nitroreductase [Saccharopolyspora phatthalungensis]
MNPHILPIGSLTADQVRKALLAAIAAPSLCNSQPWRFHCTPSVIELHADRSRTIHAADPEHRELVLACGAALLNLRLTIRVTGVHPDVRILPDRTQPDLLATVRPAGPRPATPLDHALVAAIPRRHTNRRPFLPSPVPTPLRSQLRQAAEAERGWLAFLDQPRLAVLQNLVHRAHQAQLADEAFVAEWRQWIGRDGDTRDGVPARTSGPRPEPQDEWVLRDYSAGQAARRVAGKDFEPEPLICVLGSFQDSPAAQLQAGLAMQRVLLTATGGGLSSSFLSQVVEVPTARADLRALLGGGLWPQAVLRIGYGSPVPATPRRPLEDVVTCEPTPAHASHGHG